MSIASSRERSRASFPSRPRSGSRLSSPELGFGTSRRMNRAQDVRNVGISGLAADAQSTRMTRSRYVLTSGSLIICKAIAVTRSITADQLDGTTSMSEIKTEFLFSIALEAEVDNLGDTPYGSRRVGRFGQGSFEGPKIRGKVLPGGVPCCPVPIPVPIFLPRRSPRFALPRLGHPAMRLRALVGRQRRVKKFLVRGGNREIHGAVSDFAPLQGGGNRLEEATASIRPERVHTRAWRHSTVHLRKRSAPTCVRPRGGCLGIRDLAPLSKTLAPNRKSCTGVAATKGRHLDFVVGATT